MKDINRNNGIIYISLYQMLQQAKSKLQALFPARERKIIEDWDFVMVFEEYYCQQIEMLLDNILCKDKFKWTVVQNEEEKQSLFLLKFTEQVVIEMAHELKILKRKNKLSYQFKLKDLNTLIYTTNRDKSQNIYNYLCFIRARMFPKNKLIYQQEQYSAFNKQKIDQYYRDQKGNLFTDEEQLKSKYHFLLTYQEKIKAQQNQSDNENQIKDEYREPFMNIMKRPGFVELVPVQKVSKFKVLIFGSLKDYLGGNIDCYFDFVSFMQLWLVFPMVIGLFTIAINSYFQYTVQNSPVDFFYALLVMLWSILFITKWEQVEKWLQIKESSGHSQLWSEHQNIIDRRGLDRRVSSVTGEIEYYIPLKKRIILSFLSNAVCFAELLLTIIFMIYSLNARGFIDPDHKLFYSETFSSWASQGGIFDKETNWGQIPNIIHVIVLNSFDEMVYRPVAKKLAKFENHRTPKGYENSIIFKYFVYEFFITFADLFYIAFVRFDIEGLREQLLSLFFIDIVRRVVAQSVIPWLKKKHRSRSVKKASEVKVSKEDELKIRAILEVNKQEYEPFDDYLEIITNLGYLVMISSCFPLAPLLIIIAHGVELIQDKYKIVHILKRKLPQKYVGMGRWKNIVIALCYISIITNILLFAFSSQQIVSLFPKMFENGKDLIYGNTDFSTLFGGAAEDILNSMIDISSQAINKTGSSFLMGALLSGAGDAAPQIPAGQNLFGNMLGNKQQNTAQIHNIEGLLQSQVQEKEGEQSPLNLLFSNNQQQVPQKNTNSNDGWEDVYDPIIPSSVPQAQSPSLQAFTPPAKKEQTTFIALLFFIQHFFLIGFIILRQTLAKTKSTADVFLQRRQYKRRIKKNLPKNVLRLLAGSTLVADLVLGKTMKKSILEPKLKSSDSEQQRKENLIGQILLGSKAADLLLGQGQGQSAPKQENHQNEGEKSEEKSKND